MSQDLWGYGWRTAGWGSNKQAPRFLYHNADERNRESILRDGLSPSYDQTAPVGEEDEHGGAYATDTFRPQDGSDWWRIDTAKLPTRPETDWTTDPPDENENWYWIHGGVPPHALTLHHPHTASRTAGKNHGLEDIEFVLGGHSGLYHPDAEYPHHRHLSTNAIHTPTGQTVAYMDRYNTGELYEIHVDPEFRRRGIATGLFDWTKNNIDPDTSHSLDMTDDGKAWSRSMGWNPRKYNPKQLGSLYDDHHTASRTAMPAIDAYDDDPQFDDDYNPIPGTEQFPEEHRYDEQEIQPGPYYHATDQVFKPGDVVKSHRLLHGPSDRGNHADWVWMGREPNVALSHAGPHLYEVEPMDEGPFEWNLDIFSQPSRGGRFVSPRARVVRVVPHDYPFWKDHKHASRTAMPDLNKAISDFAQNGYSEEPEWGHGDCLTNSLSFMEGLHPSFNPRLHQFFLPTVSAFPNPARKDLQNSESDPGHWETDELVDDGVYAPADHYAPVINHQGRDHVVDWTMNQFDPHAKVPHIEPLDEYSKRFSYDEPTTEFDTEWKKEARIMTAAITVYTQPSCIQCTMTKKQLDKLGIDHDTVDVSTDPDAHAYVTGLGYTSAPVVVVGDGEDHWAGFRPDRLRGLVE